MRGAFCTLQDSHVLDLPHFTLARKSDLSSKLLHKLILTFSDLIAMRRHDMQRYIRECLLNRGRDGKCRTGKKQTYQTTSGVIMLMSVTHSLPSLCPLLQGVSHSDREKQMRPDFGLFSKDLSQGLSCAFVAVWIFFSTHFQNVTSDASLLKED